MIPTAEWKFFEGMEQRLKHLHHHARENEWALFLGEPLPWPTEDVAARQAALLQEMEYPARLEAARAANPNLAEVRHLELHRRGALGLLFETHPELFPLVQAIREEIVCFSPELGGRKVSRAELHRVLARSPDRDRREEAWRAMSVLGERLAPDVAELMRRREVLARAVAGAGFPVLACHVHEEDRSRMVGLLDQVERSTRSAYEETREEIARELDVHEVEPWDWDYGLFRRGGVPDEALPEARLADHAVERARRWGLPPRGPLAIRFAETAVSALALAVEIPSDVRLLAPPGGGIEATEGFFQAYGQALHALSIQARRHFLEQDAPALFEASGFLFASALRDRAWLAGPIGVDPAAVDAHLRADRGRRLFELRRLCAFTAFENLAYTQSSLEPGRLFADVMEQAMLDTRRADSRWATDLLLVTRPLHRVSVLSGMMIAAALRAHLAERFPSPAEEAGIGPWLTENLFAPGARVPWEEKVATLTGRPLGPEALLEDLGVAYAGPSLGAAED